MKSTSKNIKNGNPKKLIEQENEKAKQEDRTIVAKTVNGEHRGTLRFDLRKREFDFSIIKGFIFDG